jgi:hypothetical protein
MVTAECGFFNNITVLLYHLWWCWTSVNTNVLNFLMCLKLIDNGRNSSCTNVRSFLHILIQRRNCQKYYVPSMVFILVPMKNTFVFWHVIKCQHFRGSRCFWNVSTAEYILSYRRRLFYVKIIVSATPRHVMFWLSWCVTEGANSCIFDKNSVNIYLLVLCSQNFVLVTDHLRIWCSKLHM